MFLYMLGVSLWCSRAGSMPDPELVHQVPSNGDLPQLEKGAERTAPPGDSVQLGTSTPKSVPTGPLSPSRERPGRAQLVAVQQCVVGTLHRERPGDPQICLARFTCVSGRSGLSVGSFLFAR